MFSFDSHLHFFSHDFFAAMVRQKDAHADIDRALAELAARLRIALPDREVKTHLRRWLQELDGHGVNRAVVFASLPEEVTAVAEAMSLAQDRLAGFFLIHPLAEGSVHRLHKCHELGWRKDIFQAQQQAMSEAQFSTAEMELVCGGDAARLLER